MFNTAFSSRPAVALLFALLTAAMVGTAHALPKKETCAAFDNLATVGKDGRIRLQPSNEQVATVGKDGRIRLILSAQITAEVGEDESTRSLNRLA